MSTGMTSTTIPAHVFSVVASLLICSLPCNLSADSPQIRVSVTCEEENDGPRLLSALSHELRKLDGVLVTDTQPAVRIDCLINRGVCSTGGGRKILIVYACSLLISDAENRMSHGIYTDTSIDRLAHEIAIDLDARVIEKMRRSAPPSSSP